MDNSPQNPSASPLHFLVWARKRANDFIDAGQLQLAVLSMISDLTKHDGTRALAIRGINAELIAMIERGDAAEVRRWVEGFRAETLRKGRPDLRVPMAERNYPSVEKPIMTITTEHFLPPATTMCAECPLARTAIPGALGGYTVAQYLEVLHGPADLACHMSKGFPHDRAEQRSCAGVAMYRANLGLAPPGHAGQAVRDVAAARCDLAFASPAEFAEHHNKS